MRRSLPLLLLLAGLALPAVGRGADLTPTASPSDSSLTNWIHWSILPWAPCERQPVTIYFGACRCNVSLGSVTRDETGRIVLDAVIYPENVCVQCDPESLGVSLGNFAVGEHEAPFRIVATIVTTQSPPETRVLDDVARFWVAAECQIVWPLPYVGQVIVGDPPCPGCPEQACAGDSISLLVVGEFPDNCIWLRSAELVPSPAGAPPQPGKLVIRYGVHSCLDVPCVINPRQWFVRLVHPPLPAGEYYLPMEAFRDDECTGASQSIGVASGPFTVRETCGPPPGCFAVDFVKSQDGTAPCDYSVSPEDPAVLPMWIYAQLPLAGVQGRFALSQPGLRVGGITPVGPAAGMHLQWTETADGARFVLFAEQGAPIPNTGVDFVPFLQVVVAARPGGTIPDYTRIVPLDLIASDSLGGAVHPCTISGPAEPGAGICGPRDACDENADGVSDIRDLVLMVHCIQGVGFCPDTTLAALDCDGDGAPHIDDVFCCAHAILRQPMPGDTTGSRPEPAVAIRLGDPSRTATGVDLPLALLGADRVGAARLELSYPAGRYEVTGVEVSGNPSDWLGLHEVAGDRLVIGLIGLGAGEAAAVELVVHLKLKAGESPGGEAALIGTQLSGPDGVTLAVDAGQPARPLGPPAPVALSLARPNPFAHETRFTVTLAEAGDLDVSVYDLHGRRVADLFQGRAAAGSLELAGPGRSADGARVASGIYLLRAGVGGAVATRKVMVTPRE